MPSATRAFPRVSKRRGADQSAPAVPSATRSRDQLLGEHRRVEEASHGCESVVDQASQVLEYRRLGWMWRGLGAGKTISSTLPEYRAMSACSREAISSGMPRLHLCEAAIHKQFCSRDVAAVVRGEKHHGLGDLIGCTESAERRPA